MLLTRSGFFINREMKIGIIGAGNMGVALSKGLIAKNYIAAKDISLSRRRTEKLSELEALGCFVSKENTEVCKKSDVIIVAVLPQKADEILKEIAPYTASKTIISIITGISVERISELLSNDALIVRAMPNTALSVGESMTCIASGEQKAVDIAISIFEQLGSTIVINEEKMSSATALCACGTAFFLRAIRAASQGGIEIDFHAEEALKMARQTALGAAKLLIENESHPEDEIDRVTSPKGCTIAGLNHMEHNGFSSAFIKGITTSAEMSKNLYKEE